MLKKLLIMLMISLPGLIQAQLATGEWYTYPVFTDDKNSKLDMVEGNDNVIYFVSDGHLFSYNDNTKETYSYTKGNRLSDDANISFIQYNYANDYLVVVYDNGNIDLLYADGNTINLSDIKDATMNIEKRINAVNFYDNRIYVATAFGLVVFDDKASRVLESGNYGIDVNNVVVYNGYIVITSKAGKLYMAPAEGSHISLEAFKLSPSGINLKRFFTLGDDDKYFYGFNNNTVLRRYRLNYPGGVVYTEDIPLGFTPERGWIGKDGMLYVSDADATTIARVKDGAVVDTRGLSASFKGNIITTYDSASHLWAGTPHSGLGYYDISAATPTVLVSPFKPDALNISQVGYLTPSPDGSRIYAHNLGPTKYKYIQTEGFEIQGVVQLIENGEFTNLTLDPASAELPYTQKQQAKYGTRIVAPSHLAEDAADPSIIYIGGSTEGIYKVQNGKEIGKYSIDNSPMGNTWAGARVFGLAVDRGGNLWMVTMNDDCDTQMIYVLPFAKTQLPTAQVKPSDWKFITKFVDRSFFQDLQILVCQHSNMIFILRGNYDTKLIAIDTKGTFNNLNDDQMLVWDKFVDQDGKDFSLLMCYAMVEDKNGKVWVAGNGTGVMEIPNPSNATNPSMTVNRVKVPRNDGTEYADYLLSTENIYSMCIDPSNRKWIGTKESGVYLVSERGDVVLEHYTTANSSLPDNCVLSVRADMAGNNVYMGTLKGLTVYSSTSSAPSTDYSEVYAYPNPVRPEYGGMITIAGLMDRSLVKICDAMGSVLYQGTSEGGTFMWDACDMSGNRVKSGVYYVYASQNASGSPSGAPATKILVVN